MWHAVGDVIVHRACAQMLNAVFAFGSFTFTVA